MWKIFFGNQSAPGVSVGLVGILVQLQGQAILLQSGIIVFLAFADSAKTIVRFRIGRIQFGGFAILVRRALEVPSTMERASQANVANLRIRRDGFQLAEFGDSFSVEIGSGESGPQTLARFEILWVQTLGFAILANGGR